jgi:tripartite-type tricarboxylate transporter receptor subunit TctC
MAGVKMRHVPYRGSAPALQGLLAEDVDMMFDNLGVSLGLTTAGQLKLLAVASSHRLPAMLGIPTIAETLPGFEAVAWYAMVAPPKTPKTIIDKVNADVNEALAAPEIRAQLKKLSAEVFGGPVEKSAKYLQDEVERWGRVIKAAKVEVQ